ncbi:efflux RND transporter periplasmic adaptor subunit [Cellvibrio sp. pealriver]|uniref:efflux RND transporter periplasmic adaptor subunit n=1 Tax=Cellvibrio sp. pealriver TaxID=1622269 RepID=UPI00066FC10F|nr:efflux RND transporter periplasmic adaptor subunit [Cellvibrio sp. pealriver]
MQSRKIRFFSLARPQRLLMGVFILLGIVALVWLFVIREDDNRVIYTTEAVTRGDIENLVTATGTLQPQDYVDVGAQVSGQLKKLHVDVGSEVKAGDLLAEIDATVYAARVDATRASLRTQQAQLLDREAQLTLANIQYEREKNLFKEEATTRESVQTAEASLKSAQAQLKALQAQIEQTESTLRVESANLNYAKIYAPIDGTVVSITSRQGQTLNTNQMAPTIMRIADLSTMTVQTQVSEADIGKLRTGMEVYFTTLGSQGRRWYSKLNRIQPTPEILNNVVLYNALFDVPNEHRLLMTQMSTQVFFIESQAKDVLLVPMSAVSFARPTEMRPQNDSANRTAPTEEQRAAWKKRRSEMSQGDDKSSPSARPAIVRVMNGDGDIEERKVLIGVTNRVQAQIVEGLTEGEKVVSGSSRSGQQKPVAGIGMGGPGMGMGRR